MGNLGSAIPKQKGDKEVGVLKEMPNEAMKETWHQAVMWRGVEMLLRLREMSPERRMRVMQQANKHNLAEPLYLAGPKARFEVPEWGDKPLTAAQVTALLVFGLWVQVGEDDGMASGLIKDWPEIRMAVFLCGVQGRPAETLMV